MKTSNKLLIGLLVLFLIIITVFAGVARYHYSAERISGDGNRVSQSREVAAFSGIRISGKIKVYITQGPEKKLEIRADQNLLPLIHTGVDNEILTIDITDHKIDRNALLEVYLSTGAVRSLDISGEASVETVNGLKGEELQINGSSGSTGNISLQYKNLICDFSSGASVKLSGNVESAAFVSSAGARIEGSNLTARKCSVDSNAGSYADVKVVDELTADVSSGSMFQYSGDPSVRNINASSGGTIQKR